MKEVRVKDCVTHSQTRLITIFLKLISKVEINMTYNLMEVNNQILLPRKTQIVRKLSIMNKKV